MIVTGNRAEGFSLRAFAAARRAKKKKSVEFIAQLNGAVILKRSPFDSVRLLTVNSASRMLS